MKITRYRHFITLLLFAVVPALMITSCQDDPEIDPEGTTIDDTPKSRAFITMIQVNEFPAVDPNGDNWDVPDFATGDSFGRPDIFVNLTPPPPDPPVLWSQESHFDNVDGSDTIGTPFYLLDEFEVIPIETSYDINIYDFELPDSTLMATIPFFIGKSATEPFYPEYLFGSQNGYSVVIRIRWEE